MKLYQYRKHLYSIQKKRNSAIKKIIQDKANAIIIIVTNIYLKCISKKNNYINKVFIYPYCSKYIVYNNSHNLIYEEYLFRPRYFRKKK